MARDRAVPLALTVLLLAALAGACGGGEGAPAAPPAAGGEEAWLALLAERGLEPDQEAVEITGSRDGAELALRIAVPADAPGEIAFADGLYGAEAFTFADGGWTRVDTADIRTEIAPLLQPGQSAELRLPVTDADTYRVLVPVMGSAAWADVG